MKINHLIRIALIAAVMLGTTAAASAGVFISVNFGPPALPVYEQPPCPAEGYIWTPGYWAYGPYGYYWVPGTWVLAPQPGLLWTPGYWGWNEGLYYWHAGFWGPTVGFYGGIPYGYGYPGNGYYGGEWRENHFFYNRSVTNVNVVNVRNVYNTTVINNTTNVTRVSYNGGPGGVTARPTAEQERFAVQRHVEPTSVQMQHETTAKDNPQLRASVNQGRPAIAATAKPADFSGHGVVAASRAGAPYKAPANNRPAAANNNVPRPGNNAAPMERGNNNAAAAPRNAVPRPPSASNGSPRPEGNSRPEPSARVDNQNQNAPRGNVPRPPSNYQQGESRGYNQPNVQPSRPESMPREGNAARPETSVRPEPGPQPRPENAPKPQSAQPPREGQPREAQPRNEPAPHPQGEPRPEPHQEPHMR